MGRRNSIHALLLGLLAGAAALAGVAPTAGGDKGSVSGLAAEVAASCVAGAATPRCCEAVVASVELAGGSASLHHMGPKIPVLQAGLDAAALLALFANCRGLQRSDGSDVRALSSSATVVPSTTSAVGTPARGRALVAKMDATAEPWSAAYSSPLPPRPLHLSSEDKRMLVLIVAVQVIGLLLALVLVIYKMYRCFHAH